VFSTLIELKDKCSWCY